MRKLFNSIISFTQAIIFTSIFGSGICLVAGEIRLAALKKASQGSSKLSGFTQKMTGMNLDFLN